MTAPSAPTPPDGGRVVQVSPYPAFDGTQPCASTLPDAWFGQAKDDDQDHLSMFRAVVYELCAACPFAEPCRSYARGHDVWGIWGGEPRKARLAWQKANGVVPIRLLLDPLEVEELVAS